MSVLEIRDLARVVIDAGGNLTDLKALTAQWEASVQPSPIALCRCRPRRREWRLPGEAVDVAFRYLTRKAYHAAAERPRTERRGVIAKGSASGWAWEATPRGHGLPWTCALCHPPIEGFDVEYRDVLVEGNVVNTDGQAAGRLQWRLGYGWRRDGQLDGDPLPPVKVKPDAWFHRSQRGLNA